MTFEYGEYSKGLLFGAAFLIISSLLIVYVIFEYVKRRNIKELVIGIFMSIYFFSNAVEPFGHGIHLVYEKENDKIEAVGEVTEIEPTYGLNVYIYNKENSFASHVFIDGEKYYVMNKGDLEIGDEVRFEYLPKSKIILSIDEIDTEQ